MSIRRSPLNVTFVHANIAKRFKSKTTCAHIQATVSKILFFKYFFFGSEQNAKLIIYSKFLHTHTVSSCYPFLCSECGKRYRHQRDLNQHQLGHSAPTIQCPECPMKFHIKGKFQAHFSIHQKVTFKCSECTLTFRARSSLSKHICK